MSALNSTKVLGCSRPIQKGPRKSAAKPHYSAPHTVSRKRHHKLNTLKDQHAARCCLIISPKKGREVTGSEKEAACQIK